MSAVSRRNPTSEQSSSAAVGRIRMDKDDDPVDTKKRSMFRASRSAFRLAGVILIITAVGFLTNQTLNTTANGDTSREGVIMRKSGGRSSSSSGARSSRGFKILLEFENCTVSFQHPPAQRDWTTKPLWLPAYPGSGAASASKKGDVMKPLIDQLTGLKAGVKNYHMSGPRLKRCYGPTETAACSNGHPSISAIGPEKQTAKFHPHAVVVLRNFHMAFPAMFYDKAMAYHSATEQVDEDKWRQNRDEWIKPSIQSWFDIPLWWINATDYYSVPLFIPFERLMDTSSSSNDDGGGRQIVERLATILQNAGFTVPTSKQDLHCIWYQTIKKEFKRQETFYKYTPGYTIEQRRFMLSEMKQFMTTNEKLFQTKAPEFLSILKEYYEDIKTSTKIDHPFDQTSQQQQQQQ